MQGAPPTQVPFALGLGPHAQILIDSEPPVDSLLDASMADDLGPALLHGAAVALLELAARRPAASLPASLAWFRDLARDVLVRGRSQSARRRAGDLEPGPARGGGWIALPPRDALARGSGASHETRRRRRGAGGLLVEGVSGTLARRFARSDALPRRGGRPTAGKGPARHAAAVPGGGRAVAWAAQRSRPRRLPGRRHGLGQDDPGPGPPAGPQGPGRCRPAPPARRARVPAGQLAGRSRPVCAVTRPAYGSPLWRWSLRRTSGGGGSARDDLWDGRHPDLAHRVLLGHRDPRRGPSDQEPRHQAKPCSACASSPGAAGPDRHAGRKPGRRPVEPVPLPPTGPLGLGGRVSPLRRLPGLGAGTMGAVASIGESLPASSAQDRQGRRPGPPHEDGNERGVWPDAGASRALPADGLRVGGGAQECRRDRPSGHRPGDAAAAQADL